MRETIFRFFRRGKEKMNFLSFYLGMVIFSLTADRLSLSFGNAYLKFGYLLILGLWFFKPSQMGRSFYDLLKRLPRWSLILLLPLAVSVLGSDSVRESLIWVIRFGFAFFASLTTFAFLDANRFDDRRIRSAVSLALVMIAFFGFIQMISLYVFHHEIFDPQIHRASYRINGVANWPNNLNVYAFLLIPFLLVQEKIKISERLILIAIFYIVIQSTSKTFWLLVPAMGMLAFFFSRKIFVRQFLSFLMPAFLVLMLIPTPQLAGIEAMTGAEKVATMAKDFDVIHHPDSSVMDRMVINRLSYQVWKKHPAFGVGPRAYSAYMQNSFHSDYPELKNMDVNGASITRHEHVWLEFLAENGFFFTLVLITVLAKFLWVKRWQWSSEIQMGAWCSLVLYWVLSTHFSQNGIQLVTFTMMGIYAYISSDRFKSALNLEE
jgi:hypothetical protein